MVCSTRCCCMPVSTVDGNPSSFTGEAALINILMKALLAHVLVCMSRVETPEWHVFCRLLNHGPMTNCPAWQIAILQEEDAMTSKLLGISYT